MDKEDFLNRIKNNPSNYMDNSKYEILNSRMKIDGNYMKETEIENIIGMNQKALMLLGYSSSLLMVNKNKMLARDKRKLEWLLKAIEDVVYHNKPVPPLPEKDLS